MLSTLAEALPTVGDGGVLGSSLICRHGLNSCGQSHQACKIPFLEPQDQGPHRDQFSSHPMPVARISTSKSAEIVLPDFVTSRQGTRPIKTRVKKWAGI
jgi:hypothetical protein